MPSKKQDDIRKIVNAVRGINYSLQRQSKELLKAFNITGPQLGAMRIISTFPEISLKELSDRMYLHVSTTCGIVDRLEGAGYINRSRSASDRRVVNISLTCKGVITIRRAPSTGFGNMVKDLHKLPLREVRKIST